MRVQICAARQLASLAATHTPLRAAHRPAASHAVDARQSASLAAMHAAPFDPALHAPNRRQPSDARQSFAVGELVASDAASSAAASAINLGAGVFASMRS